MIHAQPVLRDVRTTLAGVGRIAAPASATLRRMTASEADSIDLFVKDLRHLWVQTGRTQFTAMARHVDVSKSTLNDAVTRRDRLPSDKTVAELVGYLDSPNVNEWLARRSKLQDQLAWERSQPRKAPATDLATLSPQQPLDADAVVTASIRNRGTMPRLRLAAALLIAMTLAALGGFAAGRASVPAPVVRPVLLQDGDDPIAAGCVPDANPVASRTLEGVGTVRLLFSSQCNAYWARMDRLDDRAVGNKLELSVYEQHNRQREQKAVDPDVTNNYTFLLVRRDPSIGYCAEGIVWVGNEPTPIPEPVC